MAVSTKRVCRDCGFLAPLAGALGAMFGVCCNELSADGHVVDYFYGCGAHSDTPAPAGIGSPVYEPFDDGVFEVVTVERSAGSAGPDAAGSAPDAEVETTPDIQVETMPDIQIEPESAASESVDAHPTTDEAGPDEPAGLL